MISGTSPDKQLVEIVEVPDHPWFLGCQFHPEFKSRPMDPHPLFISFIRAALDHQEFIVCDSGCLGVGKATTNQRDANASGKFS